ncbi:MAG: pyrroloquinoline quinone precursor peptide PqqA [Ectothiorhodospiraceae bacterium]|nr:pyrroloquinoline quinone precursor peptide PqqA [Ectothiorhodospiraceae bacterium]
MPTLACQRRRNSMWTKPAYTDMRLGFEINLYVSAR